MKDYEIIFTIPEEADTTELSQLKFEIGALFAVKQAIIISLLTMLS